MRPARGAGLRHVFQWQAPVIGAPGLTFAAVTRLSFDPVDPDALTAAEIEGRRQLARFIDACNREFPTGGARIAAAALPASIGIRESLHAGCEHTLTEAEVLHGTHFDDVIARGTYRVDIHEGAGITFKYLDGRQTALRTDPATGEMHWDETRWLPEGETPARWYEIPFRSLVPQGAVNLLCAGRMLDCDRGAYGPYRQSLRGPIYRVYAKQLVKEGKAYPVFTTREELEALNTADKKAELLARNWEEAQDAYLPVALEREEAYYESK